MKLILSIDELTLAIDAHIQKTRPGLYVSRTKHAEKKPSIIWQVEHHDDGPKLTAEVDVEPIPESGG